MRRNRISIGDGAIPLTKFKRKVFTKTSQRVEPAETLISSPPPVDTYALGELLEDLDSFLIVGDELKVLDEDTGIDVISEQPINVPVPVEELKEEVVDVPRLLRPEEESEPVPTNKFRRKNRKL